MKFELNKNLFKVTYQSKEGYVIIDEISVSKEGEPYRGSISGNIYFKQKGVIQVGDKIIASTFPLSDLPQFVIEDELENIAKEELFSETFSDCTLDSAGFYKGFKAGYNKHAEKYKFTKEDIKKAIQLAREADSIDGVVDLPIVLNYPNADNSDLQIKWTEEEIIQFLQQPKEITKIEFEMEINQCDGCMSNYPIINGVHQIPYPSGKMVCKANLYNNLKITKSIKYPYGLLTIKNVKYA